MQGYEEWQVTYNLGGHLVLWHFITYQGDLYPALLTSTK